MELINEKVDRSSWPAGPWDNELEDRVDFVHVGLACFIKRHPDSGHWCGYVGIPSNHPYYDSEYPYELNLAVHGGITYGAKCNPDNGICHIPLPGMPDDVFWLGFDAAHSGDEAPNTPIRYRSWFEGSYKTAAYMIAETKDLAEQLERISK